MKKRSSRFSTGVGFARARYQYIQGEEKERKKAYHETKEGLGYSELCNAVDFFAKNIPKERQELLWGAALPSDYSELGDLTEFPYLGRNISAEVNGTLVGIRRYKYEINLFLKYKEDFESSLLVGEYVNAENQLLKIETDTCHSLWTLENRFLLSELSGKAAESKEFLSHFNEINKSKGITKRLAHYLSLRCEHSLTVNRYLNELESSLANLKESDTTEAFQNYYRFRLTFLNHLDFKNYGEIVSLDFALSIVDRYLNLTRVLTNLLAVSTFLEEQEEREIIKKYLQNRINYLIRKIDDPLLYKLKLLSGETIFPAFDKEKSEKEIKIIDSYTIGLYDLVESELSVLLLEKPGQFDLYILYIKSLVYQKKAFIPIGNKKSLQNEILGNVHKIISVTTNPDQAALNLLRIANNLTSCILSYGITDFVYHQTQGKKERNLLAKLCYNPANPLIHEAFSNPNDRINYLDLLAMRYPDSITVDFFTEKQKGMEELARFEKKIPAGKYKLEVARKMQENNDFINAAYNWESLIEGYRDTSPIFETAVVNLFKCYLNLNQPNKCLNLFVDSYFFNNHIIDKIETKYLLDKIKANKFRTVDREINLPLFYTIVDADEVEAHIAFELFNNNHNVEKPSQLLKRISEFDRKKFMYFLEFSCSSKVLMHSTFIDNSKERLEERLSIATFIREKEPANKNIIAEIKSIENILVIQQGLIDLDESKIYVNERGIIDNELQDFHAIYQRFEVISGITGNKKFLWLEGGKLTTYISQEDTEVEKIEYSNNPVFDIYLELFDAVKDKFLNSQFGIVAYLSTRIRHGVLVGELRPIFETHHLITLKEGSSNSYRRNIYWDFVYNHFSDGVKEQIQIILSDFASKVDGLIFDLIKKHLQVYKKEVNEEGWFNYEFDPSELWYHSIISIKSESFEDFVHGIFAVLWGQTDKNLDFIRQKIKTEILNQFNAYFEELERKIIRQLGEQSSGPIIKEIKDCSTAIQTVIQKISRWFKRTEIKAADFNLSELVNIVAEYTSKSSWHKHLLLEQNLDFDCRIKGEYKTHFADLIRIFLENIIKHSKEDSIDLHCKITSDMVVENDLRITIENEITDDRRLETLKSIWKSNSPDTNKLLNEGKSGYHKAFKILTSDLHCSKNGCLTTSISDDYKQFSVLLSINIKDLRV